MPYDSLVRTKQVNKPEFSGYIVDVLLQYLRTGTITGIATNTGQLTGVFYPLKNNISGYVTTGQLTGYATKLEVTGNNVAVLSYVDTVYYPRSNPSGYLTSGDTSNFMAKSGAAYGAPSWRIHDVAAGRDIIDYQADDWFIQRGFDGTSVIQFCKTNELPFISGFDLYATGLNGYPVMTSRDISGRFILWDYVDTGKNLTLGRLHLTTPASSGVPGTFKFTPSGFILQGYRNGFPSDNYVIDLYGTNYAAYGLSSNRPFILGFDISAGDIRSSGYGVLTTQNLTGLATKNELLLMSGELQDDVDRLDSEMDEFLTGNPLTGDFTITGAGAVSIITVGSTIYISGNTNLSGVLTGANVVYTTGNQTISGTKTFAQLTQFTAGISSPYVFSGNANVDVSTQQLANNVGTYTLNWQRKQLTGTWDVQGLTVSGRPVFTGQGNFMTVDTSQDVNGNKTFYADQRFGSIYSLNPIFQTRINMGNANLYDTSGNSAINWSSRILRHTGDRLNWSTRSMTGTWDAQGLTVSGNPVLTGFNSGQFITTGQTGSFVSTGITGNAFYPRFGNPAGYITASQAGGVNSLIVTGTALSGAITISGAGGISVLTGYAGQNIIAVSGWDTGQYITTAMTGRFVTTGQTGQFVTTGQTGQFVTSAQTGQFLTTANNRVTSITVTGASLTGNVTLTGVGGLNVSLSGNVVLISGGATSSSISNAVTGISVTGSYTLTGTVSFQQTGGIRMFVSGSTITFSGVSGNVTNNITNNNFINSGSGLYVYQTQLSTGSDIQFIPFPVTLDPNATVVTSIQNASSDIILGSQISGITTTGYWLTLSDTPLNTGYFVHSHVCNSSGTGLATTVINNYSNDYTYVVFTTGNQAISGLKNFINTGRFERIEVAGRIQNTTGDLVLMVANSQSGYGVYISGGQAQPTNINGGPVVIRGGDALNGFGGHVRITAGIGDLLFPGGHGGGDVVVTAGFGDDSSGGSVYLAGGAGVVTNGYVIADNLIVSGSGNFSGLYVNNTPVLTGFNSGEYVTLNTVQTITNNKTFSADTYFGSIYGNGGAPTRINLNNGNWYDINDDSSIGVNTRALRYSGDRLNWNTRSLTGTWDAQGLTISGISVLTGFNSGQYLTGPYGVTSLIVTGFVWSGTAITGQRYSGNVILSGVAGITVITGAQYTGNNVIIISGIANQTGQFLTSANVVFTTGNQSITGSKTFNLPIICPSVLDSNTDASVAVDGRKLYNTSSSYTVDWQNRILEDSSSHAINWGNKHLIDDDDTTSLDWHNRRLYSHWLVSGNLNVTGNITASGNHVLSGNAGDILTVINGSFAQQSNAIRGRGTGNSDNAWQGRVVGGGTGAAIFIGEGNGKGVLGVHNYAMDAWRDLYLNYGGTATCYIGDGIGDGNVSLPVLTVKNTSGVVGVANAIPSAVFDISGINANVVPLKIQRYPGVNANLTEWINNTGVVIPRLVAFVSPSGLISGSNMVVGGSGNFLQGLFINGVPVSTGASSATVTNVVFTTGAQRVSGHKTMLSGMNVSGRFTVNNTATNTIGDVAGDSIVQESFLGTLSANGYEWIFDIYAYKSGSAGRVYSNTPYRFDVFDDGSTDSFRWNITWNAVPGALGYRVVIVNDDYVGIYGDDSVDTATNQLYYDDTALYNGNANVQFSSPWTEIFPAITSSGINTLSGHLNVLGTTHFKADVNITGGLFITGNADTTAYITNYSTIQQANALRLQGVGSSASVWKGRLVAGGETVAFIMGEFANKAWLGAHNAALNAWADFYVNPGGDNNCYIGDDIGDGVTLRPIITVRNNGGTAGFRHHTPTAVVDISGTSTSSVVPLRINRYSGAAAYLTEWNNVTGNGWTKTTVAAVTNSGMFSGANLFIGGSGNFMQGLYISGIPVNTGASSASVTNVVFTTGNQSISGQKIFLTGMIVSGDVTISGHLSATTKSFLINHPTKSGQKLQYGVLEGPEHAVYARGKTNENYVMLPDYWVNLVNPDSITVNLTPLGVRQNLYVEAVSVSGISVNQEGSGYYYYHVFAERKDVPRLEVEF